MGGFIGFVLCFCLFQERERTASSLWSEKGVNWQECKDTVGGYTHTVIQMKSGNIKAGLHLDWINERKFSEIRSNVEQTKMCMS